jgi:pilus biogenesis lipoprotein CpaD
MNRMFEYKYGSLDRILALAALLVMSALTACGPAKPMSEEELAQRHMLRPPIEVEHTVHRHLVPIDPARVEFREQQRRDIYDFLVGVGAQPGDKVIVAARRERLDHRAVIVHFVRELGLQPDLRLIKDPKVGAEDDGFDRAILVQFNRYVSREMECGRWKHDLSTRFNNVNPQNFGCANTAALQSQIAYPSSLVSGEPLDFPEGDVAAESISRYRGRQVEQIKPEAASAK